MHRNIGTAEESDIGFLCEIYGSPQSGVTSLLQFHQKQAMPGPFQSAGEPSTMFRFGEFTFDCGSHQLMRDGMALHISPKARQLLQLLLLSRPRALSREELYDALWPSTFVRETNLASIVNELRRTLGDCARESQYVRTIHGFGYAFCREASSWNRISCEVATLLSEDQRYPLYEGENSVGRASDGCVVLSAPTISRHHAVISIDKGNVSIRDLESTNGTYVDGKRIGRSSVIVTPRARIKFGAIFASIIARKNSSTQRLEHGRVQALRR